MVKLVALALVLSGCLIKPNRVAGDAGSDKPVDGTTAGSGDDSGVGGNAHINAHVLSTAFFGVNSGSSPHVSATTWELATPNLMQDELAIIVGNVDGDVMLTNIPPGFALVAERHFGPPPGQTYFAFAGFADANGAPFSGGYTSPTSGYMAMALVAVHGATMTAPPVAAIMNDPCTTGCAATAALNVKLNAPEVITIADDSLLLFAGGADWLAGGQLTMQSPGAMSPILQITDEGTATTLGFSKTSLMLAVGTQATAGTSDDFSGAMTTTGAMGGLPWTMLVGVAPIN